MLKQIKLEDFLFFKDSEVNFGTGINVVLGGNDTGKTSLLKISNCLLNSVRRQPNTGSEIKYTIYTNYFSAYYRLNFPPVFEPKLKNKKTDFSYEVYTENFAMEHITEIPSKLNSIEAATSVEKKSVFFPNKELLTYIPWFFGLDIDTYIEFDTAYVDFLNQINRPPLKNPPFSEIIIDIESMVGGKFKIIEDRFYTINSEGTRFICNVMSEGFKKFATLAYLLKNGSLNKNITLFWDEPEANLNPNLIRKLAEILTFLASNGIQIVLATHSLFLMKELHLLSKEAKSVHYIGLIKENDKVRVNEADDLNDLELIQSLEAELDQANRYLNS